MLKYSMAFAIALACSAYAGTAGAQSSFTETCSNYGFFYSSGYAAMRATCLTPEGRPNDTTLVLTGIVNVNGVLTNLNNGTPSTFQTNCGSIKIYNEGPYVTLSAMCRMNNNQFSETSLSLNNINNKDGTLVQGK
jgi:CVNH domain-containing protein